MVRTNMLVQLCYSLTKNYCKIPHELAGRLATPSPQLLLSSSSCTTQSEADRDRERKDDHGSFPSLENVSWISLPPTKTKAPNLSIQTSQHDPIYLPLPSLPPSNFPPSSLRSHHSDLHLPGRPCVSQFYTRSTLPGSILHLTKFTPLMPALLSGFKFVTQLVDFIVFTHTVFSYNLFSFCV